MKRLLLTGLLAGSAVAGDGYVADVQLGYEYGTVGASGEQDLQHLDVTDDDLHEGASLLDVKLALGTQRLGWDKLNSYVLGQFVRDFAGSRGSTPSTGTPTPRTVAATRRRSGSTSRTPRSRASPTLGSPATCTCGGAGSSTGAWWA